MRDLQAPFEQNGSKDYDTNLHSVAWCRRTKDKNGKVYYIAKFGQHHVYQITKNDYYDDAIKKFYVMWDDNVVMTDEVKEYRKNYKNIHVIPRYQVWKVVHSKFHKVSWLSLQDDKHGRPYYFIPKTRVIPFKTDTRFILKKDYYIFHQDINKDLTIKNKARLWYPVQPWAFQP
jgi:hypothetical protein